MKTALLFVLLLLQTTLGLAQAQTQSAPNPDIPKGMKQYFFGMLVKTEDEGTIKPAQPQADQLMQKHLAFIHSQIAAGKFLLVGPLLDNSRTAGIVIIQAASEAEAKQLMSGDPMVQSGRLTAEIHPVLLADLSCIHMEFPK